MKKLKLLLTALTTAALLLSFVACSSPSGGGSGSGGGSNSQNENKEAVKDDGKPDDTDPEPGKNTETQDSGEYEIRILSQITGKVTVSKTRANKGDKITLTAEAAEDCTFVKFLVYTDYVYKENEIDSEWNEPIEVTDNYFIMPELENGIKTVTVFASFDVHDYFAGTSWYVYDKKVLEFKENKKAEVQKGLYFEQYDVPSGERDYVVTKTKSGYSADLGDLVLNIEGKEAENAEFNLTKYGSQSISKKKNVTKNPVERTREEDPFFNTTWEIANNAGGVDCQLVFYDDGTARLINNMLSVQRSEYSVTKNGDSYIATCGINSYTFTLSSLNATQGTLKWPIQKVEREVPKKGYQLAESEYEKNIKAMTESGKIEIKGKIELVTVVRALNSLYEDKPNILVDLDMLQASFTKIDYNQFYYVKNLRSVIIPEGVTLIDSYAFQSCVNLESVTIPKSVMKIGMCAFSVCKKLASVVFVDNESTWNVGGEDVVMSDPANNVKVLTNPTLFSAITKKIEN